MKKTCLDSSFILHPSEGGSHERPVADRRQPRATCDAGSPGVPCLRPPHRSSPHGAEGVACVRAAPPDVVLLNLGLPDQCGLAVYRQIRGLDGQVPVIFVTKSREAKAAIEAMKLGAYDCLFKPPDPGQLAQVVGEALEIARRLREPPLATEPIASPETGGQLVGTSPAMRQVYKEIGPVAAQEFLVIITGASGTGK